MFKNLNGRARDPVLITLGDERCILSSAVISRPGAERSPPDPEPQHPLQSPLASPWQHLASCAPFGNNFPNLKWWLAGKNKTQHSYFPFGRLQLILPVQKKSSMAPSFPKHCQPKYSNITLSSTRERAPGATTARCGLHTLTNTAHPASSEKLAGIKLSWANFLTLSWEFPLFLFFFCVKNSGSYLGSPRFSSLLPPAQAPILFCSSHSQLTKGNFPSLPKSHPSLTSLFTAEDGNFCWCLLTHPGRRGLRDPPQSYSKTIPLLPWAGGI